MLDLDSVVSFQFLQLAVGFASTFFGLMSPSWPVQHEPAEGK
jgi:hypothetical protein